MISIVQSINESENAMNKTHTRRPAPTFLHAFTEHPASVGETYLQHFVFATRFSLRLFGAASAALIHAIFPALCETTASRLVNAMHADLNNRHGDDSSR